MATNPKYYPPQKGPQLAPRLQVPQKNQFPGPLVAIVAAAAILTAIIVSLPITPKQQAAAISAREPQQPTGIQVQLTDLKMTPAQLGSAFYLEGRLINNGGSDINGVQLQAVFKGTNGQALDTQTHPLEWLRPDGGTQNLAKAPIKPNEARPVRVYYDHYPQGWNWQMPELKVTTVTSNAQ